MKTFSRVVSVLALAAFIPACGNDGSDGAPAGAVAVAGTVQAQKTCQGSGGDHSASVYQLALETTSGVIPFSFANYDTDAFWNGGTRFVIPAGLAGKYHFDASIVFQAGNGYALAAIMFNGVTIIHLSQTQNSPTDGCALTVSGDWPLFQGEYAEVFVRHTHGAPLRIHGSFGMHKID